MQYIVTSAIEEIWPDENEIIFLGEWCKKYSRKEYWEKRNCKTLEYHWNNRISLQDDYKLILEIYENLLTKIVVILNETHKKNYSLRFWRITIGWWLLTFISISLDRWKSISNASEQFPEAKLLRILNRDDYASLTSADFMNSVMEDEHWNERFYADLAENWTQIKVVNIDYFPKTKKIKEKDGKSRQSKGVKKYLKEILMSFSNFLANNIGLGNRKISLDATYLRMLDLIKLFFALRSVPNFTIFKLDLISPKKQDNLLRNWDLPKSENDAFLNVLAALIPQYLPTCFLENFQDFVKTANSTKGLSSPKIIFRGDGGQGNDLWNFWAALRVEEGSKLVLSQHGGMYGMAKFMAVQDYELSIADRFLTWGWATQDSELKTLRASALRLIGIKRNKELKDLGDCLVAALSLPQWSYWLGSMPIGPQMEDYFSNQIKFVSNLSPAIRTELKIKIYPHDFNFEQVLRWNNQMPSLKLIQENLSFRECLKNSKIFVATYNSTTFLESLLTDIPTIIFWNPEYWELSENAEPFFEKLRSASIFFDSPESAAEHLNLVWHDVSKWWNSPIVKEAVKQFIDEFAQVGKEPLNVFGKAIQAS
jgi:putative transferase (TIGR04331 family)